MKPAIAAVGLGLAVSAALSPSHASAGGGCGVTDQGEIIHCNNAVVSYPEKPSIEDTAKRIAMVLFLGVGGSATIVGVGSALSRRIGASKINNIERK